MPWSKEPVVFDTTDALGGWPGVLRCAQSLPAAGVGGRLRGLAHSVQTGRVTIYLASDSEDLDAVSSQTSFKGSRVLSTPGPVAIPSWNNIALGTVAKHLGIVGKPRSLNDFGSDLAGAAWTKAAAAFYIFGLCDVIIRPIHSTFSDSAALLASPKVGVVGTHNQVCDMLQRATNPFRKISQSGVKGLNEWAGLDACLGRRGHDSPENHRAYSLQNLIHEWRAAYLSATDTINQRSPSRYAWPYSVHT